MDLNRMCDEVFAGMSSFSVYTERHDTITAMAMFNVQFIYFLRREVS